MRQTAHQRWWLSHLIPLAVGSKVPEDDEKWLNLIRLLQIQQLLLQSPLYALLKLIMLMLLNNKHYQEIYQT